MLKIHNPATGALIQELQEHTAAQVAQAYSAARAAQPAWAARPLGERVAAVKRFRELAIARKRDLARTLTSEVGKPLQQSMNELGGLITRLDYFVENVERATARESVFKDDKIVEEIGYEPLGVIANISAWNYPYFVGSNVFLPALLTGNAVLYKPSEFSTLTGLAIGEMLWEAGVPREVFVVLIGGGAVGTALLEQKVDGIFFTGSYATGRRIAEVAGRKMVKVQLELGGKDPVYVCEDVDVKAVAAGVADGAFYNAGQSCCSVERIYVHAKIAGEFLDAFLTEVKGFKVGDPMVEGTYIGPLTRAAQLEVLEHQVQDAVKKGAKLELGGKRMSGRAGYFEPTVLTQVTSAMEVMREESFGPIIGIQVVKDDAEALLLMNDTEYGLTAGIYTRDESRARKLLAGVHAGSAYWNCCDRVSPRLPWSGRGHSGLGSTLSVAGIQAFVQPKAWHLRSP